MSLSHFSWPLLVPLIRRFMRCLIPWSTFLRKGLIVVKALLLEDSMPNHVVQYQNNPYPPLFFWYHSQAMPILVGHERKPSKSHLFKTRSVRREIRMELQIRYESLSNIEAVPYKYILNAIHHWRCT